jgi:replication-associated recombination protein RarA
MKVSEKLPPVLMREYRDRAELMAVFTRPASKSDLRPGDFAFVGDDVQVLVQLLRKAQQATQAVGVNVLLYGPPGTGKTELAKVVAQARPAWSCSRSNTPTATATACPAATATARCRSRRSS